MRLSGRGPLPAALAFRMASNRPLRHNGAGAAESRAGEASSCPVSKIGSRRWRPDRRVEPADDRGGGDACGAGGGCRRRAAERPGWFPQTRFQASALGRRAGGVRRAAGVDRDRRPQCAGPCRRAPRARCAGGRPDRAGAGAGIAAGLPRFGRQRDGRGGLREGCCSRAPRARPQPSPMSTPGSRCSPTAWRWPPAIRTTRHCWNVCAASIETDRFGIVAHILATRGCTASQCPEFKLLRDRAARGEQSRRADVRRQYPDVRIVLAVRWTGARGSAHAGRAAGADSHAAGFIGVAFADARVRSRAADRDDRSVRHAGVAAGTISPRPHRSRRSAS